MNRFVNGKRSNYYSDTISNFSEENKGSFGISRGHQSIRYSWLADFLHKSSGNTLFNPHKAYLSFFSDRDILIQEYASILESPYPFLADYNKKVFADHNYELSNKQYRTIGQRDVESDTVLMVNPSFKRAISPEQNVDISEVHQFFTAPVYHAEAYRVDLNNLYDQYLFVKPESNQSSVLEYGFTISLITSSLFGDIIDQPESYAILDSYWDYPAYTTTKIERLVDWKVDVDRPRIGHFTESKEWVYEYNDTEKYAGRKYYPYLGAVNVYDQNMVETYDMVDKISMYPEVIYNGVRSPAKIIMRALLSTPITGKISFFSGNHGGDTSDQSRLVYSICSHMLKKTVGVNKYSIVVEDPTGVNISTGIDIETERNRRNSSVVTTEPFMVAEPICSGEIVQYSMVDIYGNPKAASYSDAGFSNTQRAMFLKIKAPLSYLKEIDRQLSVVDYNSDIIDTVIVDDYLNYLYAGSDFYDKFVGAGSQARPVFLKRQGACLDDLINGTAGTGTHYVFTIDPTGPRSTSYDTKMKVSGAGYRCRTTIDPVTKEINGFSESAALYCNNYTPTNAPALGTSTPITNLTHDILSSNAGITSIERSERFRPMIKLPGINGYVKILEKNFHFRIKQANDGLWECVYNIEFPFCPGSYIERFNMDFTGGYKLCQVLVKSSYINAGSWAVSDGVYETNNDRYAFKSSDHMTRSEFLNAEPSEIQYGSVKYPLGSVFNRFSYSYFSIIRPREDLFSHHGTIEIHHDGTGNDHASYTSDSKLFMAIDNRMWKFNSDRYLSYINKENPSYIFEIDSSKLIEDYSSSLPLNGGTLESKRWLYEYVKASALASFESKFSECFKVQSTVLASEDLPENPGTYLEFLVSSNYGPIAKDQFKGCPASFHQNILGGLWYEDAIIESNEASEYQDEPVIIRLKIGGGVGILTTNDEVFINKPPANNNDGSETLLPNDSLSSLIIEVWNNDDNTGWVPIIPTPNDTDKIPGNVIIDGLFVDGNPTGMSQPIEPVSGFSDLYKIHCVKWDLVRSNMVTERFSGAVGLSNKVLFNSLNNKSYHIAYIDNISPDGYGVDVIGGPKRNYVTMYVRLPSPSEDLPLSSSVVPSSEGSLQIRNVKNNLNFIPIDIISSKPSMLNVDGVIKKCLDIKTDYSTYVKDGKMLFRLRCIRGNAFPASHVSSDEFQILGERVKTATGPHEFDPWTISDVAHRPDFNWSLLKIKERVSKLECTYFKCASK